MSPESKLRGRIPERSVLLVASFGAFLAFLDATIVNVAFPNIRESFPDSTISTLSWILNAYSIVFAAFLVVSGRLADLVGRRRTFTNGILVFTVASVLCALAPSVEILVAFRVVQALGAAMLVPASLALVVDAFPQERRSHAVGLWGAAAALAAGLGPPIGGALVEWGDWRWAFMVNLPFGVAALWAGRRLLVESRAPGHRRLPDLAGAAISAVMLGALTLGIVKGGDWGWTSLATISCFVVSLVLLGAFVSELATASIPADRSRAAAIRPFVVGNLATIVAGVGFYAYLLTNILWLQYVWGYSILVSGLAVVPGALVAALLAARLGPLAQSRGYRLVIIPGAIVWALAYVWYVVRVEVTPDFWGAWLPGQVLSGIGVGATLPVLGSAALAAVPGGRFATASAVNSSARQIGGVLGIAVLVVIIGTPSPTSTVDSLKNGWVFSAVCFALTAVVAAFVGRVEAPAQEEADSSIRPPNVIVPAADVVADGAPTSLSGTTLLSRLPADVRARLEASAIPIEVHGGDLLFSAGDPADDRVRHHGRADGRGTGWKRHPATGSGSGRRRAGPPHRRGAIGLPSGPARQSSTPRARLAVRGDRGRLTVRPCVPWQECSPSNCRMRPPQRPGGPPARGSSAWSPCIVAPGRGSGGEPRPSHLTTCAWCGQVASTRLVSSAPSGTATASSSSPTTPKTNGGGPVCGRLTCSSSSPRLMPRFHRRPPSGDCLRRRPRRSAAAGESVRGLAVCARRLPDHSGDGSALLGAASPGRRPHRRAVGRGRHGGWWCARLLPPRAC